MDSLAFDAYTAYSSDGSTPRTPSPNTMHYPDYNQKHSDHLLVRPIFDNDDHHTDDAFWPQPQRGSLLGELYNDDAFNDAAHWQQQQQQQQPAQPAFERTQDFPTARRATFPYVRHDRDDGMPVQQYPPFLPQQQVSYNDYDHDHAIKLEDQASAPLMVPSQTFNYRPSASASPHIHAHHQLQGLPQQQQHYQQHHHMLPPAHHQHQHQHTHPLYLAPHSGLPVQHTDDAASKETQYLRRRCFNCHTTEPPSWRRSTLNPGKIVCNKCGLYERTHLRPRPLRFDELRAGNKARKQGKAAAAAAAAAAGSNNTSARTPSPKQKHAHAPIIKKEMREFGLARRASVSSSASAHSGSGASDWDDNVSIYSSGSAPPTSFSSPATHAYPLTLSPAPAPPASFSLSGSPAAHAYPLAPSPDASGNASASGSGIRVPSNPLSDIKMQMEYAQAHSSSQMHSHSQTHSPSQSPSLSLSQHPTPRKSHTLPSAGAFSSPTLGRAASLDSLSGSGSQSPEAL